MTRLRMWSSRLLDLILGRSRDARLVEELNAHLELLVAENLARGMSSEEARFAARRAFGGVEQVKSRYRDQRGLPFLDALSQDVRFAFRLLLRDRGFATTAILVLALGIGVNNLFFTLMYGYKWRGLPIDRAERVLYLSTFDDRVADRAVSLPDFDDIRSAQRSFRGLAAYVPAVVAVGDDGRAPDRFDGAYITANAFELLGITPLSGRTFTAEEERPGAMPVAVVAASVWHQRYAGETSILGRSILIDGSPVTVVGVMPDRAGFPSTATVWLPLGRRPASAEQKRDTRTLRVFGRLRDGVDDTSARGEIDAIVGRLETTYPETNRNIRARLVPINTRLLGNLEGWTPFILAGLIVVAIACANVANLIIVRSLHRAPEIAVRTSLGASRMRVVRQLLIECGVLATLGGLAGLAVSIAGAQLYASAIPEYIRSYWTDFTLDQRVFTALVVVSFGTVFICGLVPALQASKTDVNRVLKDGGRIGQGQRGTRAWTMTFLTVEIALAMVLLAQLGVQFIVTSEELPTDRVLRQGSMITATVTIPADRYPTADQRIAFVTQIEERFRRQSGVEATSVATFLPLAGSATRRLQIAGRETPEGSTPPTVGTVTVGANYFTAIGIPIARGREFDDTDGLPGRVTAIVNQRFVDVFLSGVDPIGSQIALALPSAPAGTPLEWRTVVGVSPSIRQADTPDPTPIAYVPFRSTAPATVTFLVRSQMEANTLASVLRREAHSVDGHVPLYRMLTLSRALEDATWLSRTSSGLAATVTLLSIALATVGLYAVTAHGVALRTWEIGLRMALGARSGQVVALVLRGVRLPLILGLLTGVIGALAWDRAFASGRGGVMTGDPKAIAVIAAMMTTVVVLACFFPVRRATKLNAVSALRQD